MKQETQTFPRALTGSPHSHVRRRKQSYIHILYLSLRIHYANKTKKQSPSLDLVEKPAKVFGQMQSSACQNSGRTPSPVPQANCKPAPWSIWQMAYPSHYRKMNNCMKNNSKPILWLITKVEQLYVQQIWVFPGDTHLTVQSLISVHIWKRKWHWS